MMVLVCAPFGQDARHIATLLEAADVACACCADLDQVVARFDGAGVLVFTEEAFRFDAAALGIALARQPTWSDVPIILLTTRRDRAGGASDAGAAPLRDLSTNVVVLERPLSARSLVSAIENARRSRRRQHELRERIDELRASQEALRLAVAERTAQVEREIAQRMETEALLRQSQKMEAVGQLTGGIAHDFNNMLQGIVGPLDILRRRMDAAKLTEYARFIDAAAGSANRAAALTQRLLAFSRLQSLDAKAVDVNALIGTMQALIERATNEQVSVVYELASELPAASVDANQLENAVLNLVINARDALPEGGRIVVSTRAADIAVTGASAHPTLAPGRYAVVAVTDDGVGIAPEIVDRVFEPFFTTKPLGQGTGLGLSMIYGFARQSGGVARIESAVGRGTTVSIYLPFADHDVEHASDPDAATRVPTIGDGEQVLVVEDDDAVRMVVCDVLQELGYRWLEAATPHAALPLLASAERIDLLISDVGLPGMNGRQLAEIARAARSDLPILFISGYAENATIRAGFLGQNMDMVTKPFALDVLSHKISAMIRRGVVADPKAAMHAPSAAGRGA